MKFDDIINDTSPQVTFGDESKKSSSSRYQDANKHSWSKEDDYAAMREQDERGRIEKAEKKGKIEMARQLKALGVAPDLIMKSSGLSEEEINNL